ncbi:AmmeMemoRadiSam system protein B [Candidatus Uhrbacteria bacterium]|jgi:MEMO1 family protein|nr:AmmeMemoRadiSam system protein B [Candidatus Uhrbacteria bacterium]
MLLDSIRTIRRLALCVAVIGGTWLFTAEVLGRIVDPVEARQSYIAEDAMISQVTFDERRFYDSIERTDSEDRIVDEDVKGAIIPHHALASDLIADAFNQLRLSSDPKTIVVVGPNHEELGDSNAITSSLSWKMSNGTVNGDEFMRSSLRSQDLITEENDVVISEHSIGTLLPYVAHYFPEAQIVPIVLSSKHDVIQSNRLGEALVNDDTLVIASVDFSHYLSLEVANELDEITLDAIEGRDSALISQMNSDYLDSPPSLITLFAAMDAANANDHTLLQHTNSAVIEDKEVASTTSYFTILFH